LAGTDHLRRDLMVALLWGTPIALAFGFLGAIATSIISMTIAAIGSWLDGWVDNLIQRLTEVNMILPALPLAIMVFYLYSNSVWAILGVMILLSIFGSAIKNYRAAFLQVKESPYIEAARAYGASHWRIIRHYLVPRILPLLIPQLVILIPTYVFFEATLAYLNISDPRLPTWGKVVYDALTEGAFQGYYYWVLEPIGLMMVTGLAFAMVGFALDSVLNPRLRRM
jgi:peptide/nickel transport system permease protein